MTLKDLQFMLAYAEVHGLMEHPFDEVYTTICNMFDEAFLAVMSIDEYIDDFMEHYNAMKEHHLEGEVLSAVANGDSFFTACEDWDI